MRWLSLILLAISALQWEHLPEPLQSLFPGDFAATIANIERSSTQRLEEGEWEHLIYYVLQSNAFTDRPPIEPAQSARRWHEAGGKSVPAAVTARRDAFLSTNVQGNPRIDALRKLQPTAERFNREYHRVMAFLYEKEFASNSDQGQQRRDRIAQLYQTRGHSSDSSVDAHYAVDVALGVLREIRPDTHYNDILIAGPGLDFAPRTGLDERAPPQSYQPYLTARSLLRHNLANKARLRVHCIDLNPRVVAFFDRHPKQLTLRYQPEEPAHEAFFQHFGPTLAPDTTVTAETLNLLTGAVKDRQFDLIVATNILLYFDDTELALAMTNLSRMLKRPGGILLHNDLRGAIDTYARALNLPIVHARMVRLSTERNLHDAIVLHEARD